MKNCTDTLNRNTLTWQDWVHEGRALLLRDARDIMETVTLWRTRSVQRAHLRTLDGHMLDDIGLTRAEADKVANKPFWKA